MNTSSDALIMKGLLSPNKKEANKALADLYRREYPVIARFVQNNSGSSEDVADLFQDLRNQHLFRIQARFGLRAEVAADADSNGIATSH